MVELKKAKKVCVKKIRQPLKEAREHQKWFSRSIFVLTGKKIPIQYLKTIISFTVHIVLFPRTSYNVSKEFILLGVSSKPYGYGSI